MTINSKTCDAATIQKTSLFSTFHPLLTTEEAASVLSVCPTTIRRLCRTGELTAIKVGSMWRIPPRALRDLTPHHDQFGRSHK